MRNCFIWRLPGWQLLSLKLFSLSIEQFGATKLGYQTDFIQKGRLFSEAPCNCSHKFFFSFLLCDLAHKPWSSSCSNIPHFWGYLPIGKQARVAKLMPGELLIWDWHWVQTNCNNRSVGVNVCWGLQLFTWIVTFLATGFSAMNALLSFFLWSAVILVETSCSWVFRKETVSVFLQKYALYLGVKKGSSVTFSLQSLPIPSRMGNAGAQMQVAQIRRFSLEATQFLGIKKTTN